MTVWVCNSTQTMTWTASHPQPLEELARLLDSFAHIQCWQTTCDPVSSFHDGMQQSITGLHTTFCSHDGHTQENVNNCSPITHVIAPPSHLPPPSQDVNYAVFGLGNRQYEHFNSVGKRIHSSMETLGARALVPRGDGDDDGVIDDDFEKWSNSLYAAIDASSDLVGGKVASDSVSIVLQPASYDVELLQPHTTASSGVPLVQPFAVGGSGLDSHSPFWARVSEVHELHSERSDRSCVHAELDITGSQIVYEAGDHVAIHAQNDPAVVLEMAALLGFSQDCVITLSKRPSAEMLLASKQLLGTAAASSLDSDLPEPFPGPLALRSALAYFADVLASPRREALAALAACATDPSEAARLGVLSSTTADGKATFAAYISKPKRSLLEVMREFPSARPTLGVFFASVAPRLQPRFYSISSSPAPFPRSVHVSCAVVQDVMPTGRIHDGICSSWLAKHSVGSSVPVYIRRSHFKLPSSHTTPVVMVGPGTGVAPFRGFVQERTAAAASGEFPSHPNEPPWTMHLAQVQHGL